MNISYKRTAGPASEPVTLSEAKIHLEIDHSDRDTYITSLISVAREMAEHYTNTSLFTQMWVAQLDKFPGDDDLISLVYGPVQSITSITYYDAANAQQTWDASNYRLDTNAQIAQVQAVSSWPETYKRIDSIQITYVAGLDDVADIDLSMKQGILMLIGHLYENRQDGVVGSQVNVMPKSSEYLFARKKIYHVAK